MPAIGIGIGIPFKGIITAGGGGTPALDCLLLQDNTNLLLQDDGCIILNAEIFTLLAGGGLTLLQGGTLDLIT